MAVNLRDHVSRILGARVMPHQWVTAIREADKVSGISLKQVMEMTIGLLHKVEELEERLEAIEAKAATNLEQKVEEKPQSPAATPEVLPTPTQIDPNAFAETPAQPETVEQADQTPAPQQEVSAETTQPVPSAPIAQPTTQDDTIQTAPGVTFYSYPTHLRKITKAVVTLPDGTQQELTIVADKEAWDNMIKTVQANSDVPLFLFPETEGLSIFPTPTNAYTVTITQALPVPTNN